MRWFWIDRFVEFESGRRAVAEKSVSLGEEYIQDHFSGAPMMAGSLVIEGLAQTGGILVAEYNQFEERVVLAKVGRATFHGPAKGGDTLRYTAEIEDMKADGAMVRATSHIGDRLHCEAELLFAHFDDPAFDGPLIDPAEILITVRVYGLYDVGRDREGNRLQVPPAMLAAEQAANQQT